jgi:hypothetical protein
MKTVFLSCLLFTSMSLFAQQKPIALNGIELTLVKPGQYDYGIKEGNDYDTYELVISLADECDSFTEIPKDVLGKEGLLGYFFHFEDFDVLYILCSGGAVKGSLIEKNKVN